ncbi:MAG: LutB/LldF family L-lactate oxidation iron-sulfur protein [Alphaproteobacteria bacterium]|jgi:L-lactate dehydrogenase complex protein LldF|nr:LutB/LldF family L-lactate oxidation iron-sulfur protein [Alphaproteobacteria bacterium]
MEFMKPGAFKENANVAMADENLRSAMTMLNGGMIPNRQGAVDRLPEFEKLSQRGRELKDHVLAHLDFYLEKFERHCKASGGHVHWCSTPEDARQAVLKICRSVNAKSVTKGKSMIAEEIHLNAFLEQHDIKPVETDLGEYIIQLAEEPPSHIIGPAIHKTKDQVSDLFLKHHAKLGRTERQTEPQKMVNEAREILRRKYFEAEVGITGANYLIAETGSSIIVTNEGNGDLTQTLPKIHIVVTSLEKVVPTLEDATTFLRILARSATGQEFSAYTTISTGARREGDADGPEEYHVILLDNGRSAMLGGELQDMLRCIRCGACMNHCPVYQSVGGHTYGTVYVGPMGAVLSPALLGVSGTRHLPCASTLCGRCEQVCPVSIPLPRLLRQWRERSFEAGDVPVAERWGLSIWAFFAKRPWLYGPCARLAMRGLAYLGRKQGRMRKLWFAGGWTRGRDLPAPEGQTFQERWAREKRKEQRKKVSG